MFTGTFVAMFSMSKSEPSSDSPELKSSAMKDKQNKQKCLLNFQ